MSLRVVLEVTQPYHVNGREVLYAPGEQFPVGTVLPPDVRVLPVVAEVPDAPVKADTKPVPAEPVKSTGAEPVKSTGKAAVARP